MQSAIVYVHFNMHERLCFSVCLFRKTLKGWKCEAFNYQITSLDNQPGWLVKTIQ